MLITPLNTATPIMRRALSRSAWVTGSSEASVENRPEIAREGAACARP
jgi:hypothetical protein